jgi:hypothetical protein
MSLKLLPGSGITSMVMGNDIFAYAQTYDGDICQFVGNGEKSSEFYGSRKRLSVTRGPKLPRCSPQLLLRRSLTG